MREIALVLGGGGARGIAHIHALQAFDDLDVKPSIIVGSSIGAIMGAGYAAGMTGTEIREYAIKTFGNRGEVMSRMWKLRPDNLRTAIGNAVRFGEIDTLKAMRAFLPANIPETFEELQIPLLVTATDFYAGTHAVICEGELWRAIAASAAIPAVFRPVMLNGRYFIDGGFTNPVAFDLVSSQERLVIAIDVVGWPNGDEGKMPSRVDAAFGASQLLMQTINEIKLEIHQPDLLYRPEVSDFRVLDFLRTQEILESTRVTRTDIRDRLERLLRAEQAQSA